MKIIKRPNGWMCINEWHPYRPDKSIHVDLKHGVVHLDDIGEIEIEYFEAFTRGFTEALKQAQKLIDKSVKMQPSLL